MFARRVRVGSKSEIDPELRAWLKEVYSED
jgi:hypothetical protein